MRNRGIWLAGLVALLVVGLVGTALAAEIAQQARTRFACGNVQGEPVVFSGTVTDQDWNKLTVARGGTDYIVVTGPYKAGVNLPELAVGETVTIEGFTGMGQDCPQGEQAASIVVARTITRQDGTVLDLTGTAGAGQGCGLKGAGGGSGQQVRGRGMMGGRGCGNGARPR